MINKIHQGDCLEVMKGIADKSIDMVMTDPPYGTTAVACIRTGRNFIGIEKESEYVEIANKRIAHEMNNLFEAK